MQTFYYKIAIRLFSKEIQKFLTTPVFSCHPLDEAKSTKIKIS